VTKPSAAPAAALPVTRQPSSSTSAPARPAWCWSFRSAVSAVKAFVDVQLGGVKIMGAKIVQQPDKRAWVAMPSVKSERAWNNVVELSKPLRERVTEEVLRCWATHQPPQDPLARVFDAGPPDYPLHDAQHNTGNESCPFDDDIPF
jgi:hypothetical protein